MIHLYVLKNNENKVVYVGQSKDLKRRLYQHTKAKPKKGWRTNGKFYGQDLTIHCIDTFDTLKEALKAERELKKQYGFEVTELIGSKSRIGLKNPSASKTMKQMLKKQIQCKYCGRNMNPGNYAQFHGEKCKKK